MTKSNCPQASHGDAGYALLILAAILAVFVSSGLRSLAAEPPSPGPAVIAPASDEARQAMVGFRKPAAWSVELFAAEPMLANPVAFCVDYQGRVYVCETFRQGKGIEDNRNHPEWLEDDLAAQTVADRLAYIRKHLGERAIDYTLHDDRIRRLVDADGDGRADHETVFADRFNDIVDGTGAGVLAYRGRVYYTCIPHLWMMDDADDDGRADSRRSLHQGYGVRFAFRGHDLHGLTVGPDGRLYFSVGDRGYNVATDDGRRLADPESGAVFACELDGSGLEVIATGLRNPQELAFDDFGNLFTGDNNSDSGDKARWVYVVPGGDTGWRMSYQYLDDRGPFNRERLWHPFHAGQPAYIVPAVTNLADGPSGLASYPGTGLSDHYRGRFFLCDFRGGAANSGIRTFRLRPKGAFFEVIDQEETLWNILATDVEFGPDGLYVSDWVHGWNGEGKGRIYRFTDAQAMQDPAAAEVKQLLAAGMDDKSLDELVGLLRHPDRRIRQESQFALASRGAARELAEVASGNGDLFARLHAIWGLKQLGRRRQNLLDVLEVGLRLLDDEAPEIRAQAAGLLGDIQAETAADKLIRLLKDENGRVRFFAALAIGRLHPSATAANPRPVEDLVGPLLELLAENDNADPIVRHGGIMGLAGAATESELVKAAEHPSPAARLAVAVAMRKRAMPEVAKLLDDPEILVAEEAARAIHDLPIPAAQSELAGALSRQTGSAPFWHRALNANYRLGGKENARAIAKFAARDQGPDSLRLEAIAMLANWRQPARRDRVLGMVRPLPSRDSGIARDALRESLPALLAGPENVRLAAARTAAEMQIPDVGTALIATFRDRSQSGVARAEALTGLAILGRPELDEAVQAGLQDQDPLVRTSARGVLARRRPDQAAQVLEEAISADNVRERQAALALLSDLPHPSAEEALVRALQRLLEGEVPSDTRLDVIAAARRRGGDRLEELSARYESSLPSDPVAARADALFGGDANRGRELFFSRGQLSCVRCHIIGETGGEVGPNLSKIGAEKSREYLLEALVAPSKTIAKGYESVQLITDDGRVMAGVLKAENDSVLQIMTPEGQTVSIPKSSIEERAAGKSAMPEDLTKNLTPLELRDLIEFLVQPATAEGGQ